jgi:hypothetical protein
MDPFDSALSARLTRRELLARSGALAVIGAAGLAGRAIPAAAINAKPAYSALLVSADLYASPQPQRIGFVVARGSAFVGGPPATVGFAPPAPKGSTVTLTSNDTTLYARGLTKGRGVYVTDFTFPVAGVWTAVVNTRGRKLALAMQVKERNEAPGVGQAAPRVASPTNTNALGVNPICTRRPACPLHAISLDTVIGTKPVVAMFATPALCQTAYCGPVLDELLELVSRYGDKVAFVHVEIYKDTKGSALAPAVAAWNLPSDPWLFTIDAAGVIRARLDGAIGREEMEKAITALI